MTEPGAHFEGHWEHFPHVADIGIRGYGRSLEESFEQAALAMTAVICDPARVRPEEQIRIRCEAPDRELLLVQWLNALIYEMATRGMLFNRFEVHIDESRLTAAACGEPVDRLRHRPAVEPKGATYTELRVEKCKDGYWLAQCVVDV